MKRTFLIISVFGLLSCEQPAPHSKAKVITVKKVIANKAEATETNYTYKYSVWQGGFKLVPDIHTVYKIAYTDGTVELVDFGAYSKYKIGDTVLTNK